jgi:hypothetical protein
MSLVGVGQFAGGSEGFVGGSEGLVDGHKTSNVNISSVAYALSPDGFG